MPRIGRDERCGEELVRTTGVNQGTHAIEYPLPLPALRQRPGIHGTRYFPPASPIAVASIASSALISDSPATRPEAIGMLNVS